MSYVSVVHEASYSRYGLDIAMPAYERIETKFFTV